MKQTLLFPLVPMAAVLVLSACGSIPKIPMPKIPFVNSGGEADVAPPADDPLVPFDPRKPLTYGHTLQLTVYRGSFNPGKIFQGSVMVDHDGLVTFKDAGKVKIGGLTLTKAAAAIEEAFLIKRGDQIIQVQIAQVENTPLVNVSGAVRSPGAVPFAEGLTLARLLPAVGGHDASSGRSVYLIRRGVRHYHASVDDTPLEIGDSIVFSSDI